jgi:hypothetical protein
MGFRAGLAEFRRELGRELSERPVQTVLTLFMYASAFCLPFATLFVLAAGATDAYAVLIAWGLLFALKPTVFDPLYLSYHLDE